MGLIELEGLGKRYKHYRRRGDRLREWLGAGFLRRHEEVWVLRGVSAVVEPGEAVALVGANGAGKSTLLKLVAGTTQPSEGRAVAHGRVAALELGLGFHPDFTGRENAFTAGELYGLRRGDVEAHMDAIEDFAGIGDAIDEPVRTYSSGMALRLAFSVATALRPDILIVDEVLAVGDAYFQHKCMARIRAFRDQGTTLLFASHDPAAVRTLCDRALLLDRGLLVRQGDTAQVLDYYNAVIARMREEDEIRQSEAREGRGARDGRSGHGGETRSGSRDAAIEGVELLVDGQSSRAFTVGTPVEVVVEGRAEKALPALTTGIKLRDRIGNEVFGTNTELLGLPRQPIEAGERFRVAFRLPVNVGVGNYSLTVAFHAGVSHVEGNYDWWDNAIVFQVLPGSEAPFVGTAFLPTEARLEVDGR